MAKTKMVLANYCISIQHFIVNFLYINKVCYQENVFFAVIGGDKILSEKLVFRRYFIT